MASNCGHDDWWIVDVVCVRMTRDFVKVTATQRPRASFATSSSPDLTSCWHEKHTVVCTIRCEISENISFDNGRATSTRPLSFLESYHLVTLSLAHQATSREQQEENLAGEIRDSICYRSDGGFPRRDTVARRDPILLDRALVVTRSTGIFK